MTNANVEIIDSSNEDKSDEWHALTARVAWVLWLTNHRNIYPGDEQGAERKELEKSLWQSESPEYRAYVRKALRALEKEGIFIVKK